MEGQAPEAGGATLTSQEPSGRAAVYLRVSTLEQAEEGISLAMQERVCTDTALKAGASTVEIFRDEGFTGMKLERPGLQALLARLSEFDTLWVWKMDRLCRRLRDRLELIHQCGAAGVRFRSATEAIDLDTVMGRAMAQMMGVFAELEVGQLRERVTAALRHRVEAERLHHGLPPWGYRVKEGEPIAVDLAAAGVVREIFHRYAQGEALTRIAQELNGRGQPTPWGAQWNAARVRRILTCRTYLGEVGWNGVWLPGKHDPIVDHDLFRQVELRLEANRTIHPRARLNSLSALLTCGVCGGQIAKVAGSCYICNARYQLPREQRHLPLTVTVQKADAAIWTYAEWLLTEGRYQEAVSRVIRQKTQESRSGRSTELRRRLAEIDAQLSRCLRAYSLETMPEELYVAETAPLAEERRQLQERLEEETGTVDLADLRRRLPQTGMETMERFRKQPADAQVRALRMLFSQVVLSPGPTLTFHHQVIGEPYSMLLPTRWGPQRRTGGFPLPDGTFVNDQKGC